MTDKVLDRLNEASRDLAEFLIRELTAHAVRMGQIRRGQRARIDIETIVTAIQDLASRERLELAAFVSSWHPRLDEMDQQRSKLKASALARTVASLPVSDRTAWIRSFVRAFSAAVTPSRRWPSLLTSLHKSLVDAVKKETTRTNSKRVDYLRPLFSPLRSQGGSQASLVIATLNYDNTVELAAERAGIECDFGLSVWRSGKRIKDRPPLSLLKLHGSSDWHSTLNSDEVERGNREGRPMLLFGGRNKLTAEGPFLDLLMAFAQALEKSTRLTVIGYSFRDHHVNALIARWRRRDDRRVLRVVDPFPDVFAAARRLHAGLVPSSRVVLMPLDVQSPTFECVQKTAQDALPGLFGHGSVPG